MKLRLIDKLKDSLREHHLRNQKLNNVILSQIRKKIRMIYLKGWRNRPKLMIYMMSKSSNQVIHSTHCVKEMS